MGEGEWSAVGVQIQPLWELQRTDQAVPSPVGRERVRVRVNLLELRLLLGIYFCTSPKRTTRVIPTMTCRFRDRHGRPTCGHAAHKQLSAGSPDPAPETYDASAIDAVQPACGGASAGR